MMTRTKIVVAGLCLLALVAVLAGALALRRTAQVPVYTMGTLPPERNIAVNTLTHGSTVYISGPDEWPLQPVAWHMTRLSRAGKTEGDVLDLYRPVGQAGDDFVYVTGDMMANSVYRDSRIPPVTLATLGVSALRLTGNRGTTRVQKTTRDEQIIRAAVGALTDPAAKPLPLALGDTTDGRFQFFFLSDRLPGLGYLADLYLDDAGQVYLAQRNIDDAWFPAGQALAQWVRE